MEAPIPMKRPAMQGKSLEKAVEVLSQALVDIKFQLYGIYPEEMTMAETNIRHILNRFQWE